MNLLAILRTAFLLLGAWYLTRAVQRRMSAKSQLREALDPMLTRCLLCLVASYVLFAVFFFLFILSTVRKWAPWIEWSNGIVMGIALVATFALSGVAGWRLPFEKEKLRQLTVSEKENRE